MKRSGFFPLELCFIQLCIHAIQSEQLFVHAAYFRHCEGAIATEVISNIMTEIASSERASSSQ